MYACFIEGDQVFNGGLVKCGSEDRSGAAKFQFEQEVTPNARVEMLLCGIDLIGHRLRGDVRALVLNWNQGLSIGLDPGCEIES